VNFIGAFEKTLAQEALRHDVDGVICGHIHHAAIRPIDGVTYVNIGDFVESCTVVGERHDGELEIIRWLNFGPVTLDVESQRAEAEAQVAA
jgi:UDP-2,3-diacylglucosamine pyrophosphatase LpxH